MTQHILEAIGLGKDYLGLSGPLHVLQNIHFSISAGSTTSIVGPSGSGKTTLLGLCAGLDYPTHGDIRINGQSLKGLTQNQLASLRNQSIGFIFQSFQLLPTLTALENVMVPAELKRNKQAKKIAINLLDRVGLSHRLDHYPNQLSGGEQQRVAIARAFANEPILLFADEPTGNLDGENGAAIENLLFDVNREQGTTLVIVTHDLELAAKTQQIIRLKNGKMTHENHPRLQNA